MKQQTQNLVVLPDGGTKWENAPAVPRRIISPFLEPFLVSPGKHQAVCVGWRGVTVFRTPKVLTLWRLIDQVDIDLPRYYRVQSNRSRISALASSDLVRDMERVLGWRVRRDRIPMESLLDILVEIEVRTVTHDRAQRELALASQYSVVQRIIGRV